MMTETIKQNTCKTIDILKGSLWGHTRHALRRWLELSDTDKVVRVGASCAPALAAVSTVYGLCCHRNACWLYSILPRGVDQTYARKETETSAFTHGEYGRNNTTCV